jgi:hypothetical protein
MTCRPILLTLPCLFLGASSSADTIRLADGKVIESVQVVSDGIKEVVYKEGKNDKTVPSETVVAIEYEKRPKQVDEAEGYLVAEDLEGAVDSFDAYVQSVLDKPSAAGAFKWAPAHAAWKAVEVRRRVADFGGVKTATTRLIQNFPESRFVPMAYLAKADAELRGGDAAGATKTLGEFAGVVSSQGLSKRWELEAKLSQVLADEKLKPAARRAEFERLVDQATAQPAVQARAQLLVGEMFLAEASTNASGAKDLRSKAKTAFETVLASGSAGRDSIASAHAGLGETLFLLGADVDDKAMLTDAVLQFLRVVTLFREQGDPVARSLFYAMRCFDLMGDPRRKADMKRELMGTFPSSTWAGEAKKF